VTITFSASGGSGQYVYSWTIYSPSGSVAASGTYPSSGYTSSTSYTIGFTPSSSGTYTIDLTVTDSLGDVATASASLSVNGQLTIVSFYVSPNPGTAGQTVTAYWSISGGTPNYLVSINWGDNTVGDSYAGSSTSGTFTHTYSAPGTYTVTLTVTDSAGNSVSATYSETINPSGWTATFTESGLPQYNALGQTVTWSITINGQTYTAQAGHSIVVSALTSGQSYSWSAESPIKVVINKYGAYVYYVASPSSGTVSQSNSNIYITYSEVQPRGSSDVSTLSSPRDAGMQVAPAATWNGRAAQHAISVSWGMNRAHRLLLARQALLFYARIFRPKSAVITFKITNQLLIFNI
ncbi:MAG: PKD domain-containing protein, partial [Nitrososphaeria archaeon]